jgi:hypothetical protein
MFFLPSATCYVALLQKFPFRDKILSPILRETLTELMSTLLAELLQVQDVLDL